MRDPAIPAALARLLGSTDVRHEVIEALVRFGASAVDPARSSNSAVDDVEARRSAVVALGRLGDARATPALVALLLDEDQREVWVPVAGALARLGDRPGVRAAALEARRSRTPPCVRPRSARSTRSATRRWARASRDARRPESAGARVGGDESPATSAMPSAPSASFARCRDHGRNGSGGRARASSVLRRPARHRRAGRGARTTTRRARVRPPRRRSASMTRRRGATRCSRRPSTTPSRGFATSRPSASAGTATSRRSTRWPTAARSDRGRPRGRRRDRRHRGDRRRRGGARCWRRCAEQDDDRGEAAVRALGRVRVGSTPSDVLRDALRSGDPRAASGGRRGARGPAPRRRRSRRWRGRRRRTPIAQVARAALAGLRDVANRDAAVSGARRRGAGRDAARSGAARRRARRAGAARATGDPLADRAR